MLQLSIQIRYLTVHDSGSTSLIHDSIHLHVIQDSTILIDYLLKFEKVHCSDIREIISILNHSIRTQVDILKSEIKLIKAIDIINIYIFQST